MSISVVIMAAGQGTRMKSKTPKVLHKICGRQMLYYAIKEAKKLSNDVQVVLYHESEMIKEAMQKEFEDVGFFIQDHLKYPGTAGAVMAALPKYDKVIVLNGDMPLVSADSIRELLDYEADAVMCAIPLKNPSGYGRVVTSGDEVLRIVEEKDATPLEKKIGLVNAGVYAFKGDFLAEALRNIDSNNAQKEYYLTDTIGYGVKHGKKVKWVEVTEEEFKGVNSKADLAHAEEIMLDKIRTKWMKEGVTMRLPQTIYIDDAVEFVGECEVESHCVIKGKSRIERSTVKAGSVIEDAVMIDSDCGPMARLRPKTVISGTHIGNFVECKNARLDGVKAGHLSYLGDCTAESGTNIGAGTITCNYDGVKKYETTIGKNVFIGSDTQLVAPVTLEDNTMIAAGTTVTKDVESGSLALSRTPQKNIAGFFDRFFGKK
jgi:bifunctional UDP-N-acetylglucosamine pyrophosphorylase / glucosamine-1-phosphate N-acetyltransferase